MRSFYTVVLLSVLVSVTPIQAFATGNVLVPNSPDSSNLGLGNSTSPQAPAKTTPPPTLPSQPATTGSLPYTPAPAAQETQGMPPMMGQNLPQNIQDQMGGATRVVKFPAQQHDAETAQQNMQKILHYPNSVNLEFGSWTNSNIARVSNQLGIPADKVTSMCQLSTRGILISDKGGSPFNSGTSSQTSVGYNGTTINSVMVTAVAYCDASFQLPPNKGVIYQMGNKYVTGLGSTRCQAPSSNSTPGKIVLAADTKGQLQCQFQ